MAVWNKNAIASTRRYIGYSQPQFAEFAKINPSTYGLHELSPDTFRVREFRNIASMLSRRNQLLLANAIVETIFGDGMEVKEK